MALPATPARSALLITPLSALFATALAVASKAGRASIFSPGKPQAFSESFYAYLSQANNNGSALAGYTDRPQPPRRMSTTQAAVSDMLDVRG